MGTKRNDDPVDEFCEAVESLMEINKQKYEKVKNERMLKNDSIDQVNLRKRPSKEQAKHESKDAILSAEPTIKQQ